MGVHGSWVDSNQEHGGQLFQKHILKQIRYLRNLQMFLAFENYVIQRVLLGVKMQSSDKYKWVSVIKLGHRLEWYKVYTLG